MSKICAQCGDKFPKFVWVEGKKRNCQRRKYCFVCSPFGEHNTRKLVGETVVGKRSKRFKICPDCQRPHVQTGVRCFSCYFNVQKKRKQDQIDLLLGGFKCWLCGYDKCKRNICFHHVDPSTKSFGLTTRELMLKWDRVLQEMEKCVLLCHNCHGEVHEGICSESTVQNLWKKKWGEIRDHTLKVKDSAHNG